MQVSGALLEDTWHGLALQPEDVRPSAFVLSHGNAVATQKLSLAFHEQWVSELKTYLADAKRVQHPAVVKQRPGVSAPSRLIWFTGPAVFGNDGSKANALVSTARAAAMDMHAKQVMQDLGFPIVDAWSITQSRWDEYIDGVALSPELEWMVYQVVLNTLFPTCST